MLPRVELRMARNLYKISQFLLNNSHLSENHEEFSHLSILSFVKNLPFAIEISHLSNFSHLTKILPFIKKNYPLAKNLSFVKKLPFSKKTPICQKTPFLKNTLKNALLINEIFWSYRSHDLKYHCDQNNLMNIITLGSNNVMIKITLGSEYS